MLNTPIYIYRFMMILVFSAAIGSMAGAFSKVIHDGDSTYIVDRHGERWDMTQARSIGFIPERFQHGIGRNTFTPLDDSSLKDQSPKVSKSLRVIGISDGKKAHAYDRPILCGTHTRKV